MTIFLLISQLALAQNLIVNGDFSKNPCPKGWCLSSDQSKIAPWTITSAQKTYEVDPPATFGFPSYSMDLNAAGSDAKITIQQVVPTVVGSIYELSFSLNQNTYCGGAGLKTGFVTASGGAMQEFSTSGSNTKKITLHFIASTDRTAVSIGSSTPGTTCGPVVFDVQMIKMDESLICG